MDAETERFYTTSTEHSTSYFFSSTRRSSRDSSVHDCAQTASYSAAVLSLTYPWMTYCTICYSLIRALELPLDI